jgi:hypothetical protein
LSCPQVSGVQLGAPHTPGVPPPPHVWPLGHVPQSSSPPHPSATLPHCTLPHVSFVHVGVTHRLLWQTVPAAQVAPQSTMPPHPSEIWPHWAPVLAHVCFVQLAAPHTFAEPPPPQV